MDMSLRKANRIRRRLAEIVDTCEIYPRRGTHLDSVSLALFSRMVELHQGVCLLAKSGHRRDGAILLRTLCEAVIIYYWLTNTDTEDRFDRYLKYWGKVRNENMKRVAKYFGHRYTPTSSTELSILKEAEALFQRNRWNEKDVFEMAREPIKGEMKPDGTEVDLSAQYELSYYWLCQVSHPTIMAIECFLPWPREPYSSSRPPRPYVSIPESFLLFLSTVWLFKITRRLNQTLDLHRDTELDRIFGEIKKNKQ
jgi:hypothetical protein